MALIISISVKMSIALHNLYERIKKMTMLMISLVPFNQDSILPQQSLTLWWTISWLIGRGGNNGKEPRCKASCKVAVIIAIQLQLLQTNHQFCPQKANIENDPEEELLEGLLL